LEVISPIKAVIWDVGGVLIRTQDQQPRERLAKSYNLTRAELSALVFDSEEAVRATIGEIPESVLWQMVAHTLNIPAGKLANFKQQFWAGDCIDQELHDFIGKLRPRFKTGLLSNAWSEARKETEERFHLLGVFDVLVYSAEVHLAKPDPRIFQLALERLGVQPQEAIFMDDFPANIEAANVLGMHGVHFENSQQAQQDVIKILTSDEHRPW
jgi:epoxide hydrolase-like predicted phosphatase